MTISEQIGPVAIFYFGQAFVFCRLIKKTVRMVSTNNV